MPSNVTLKVGSVYYELDLDDKKFKQKAQSVKAGVKDVGDSMGGLGPVVSKLGATLAVAFSARAVLDFFKSSIAASNEAAQVMAQTEAVIASTGMAAGLSAQQVKAMATEIQNTTAISDEAAQSGINMLLTFTKIGNEVMPQATQAMVDMATAMNGGVTPGAEDLRNQAIQLGKALNDPVVGVTALRRVGVAFNETQLQTIQRLVDTGDVMGAQKIILNELGTEFGGSAAAQVKTFGGEVDQLKNQFNDFQESIGTALTPALEMVLSSFNGVSGATGGLNDNMLVVQSVIMGLVGAFIILGQTAVGIGKVIIASLSGGDVGNAFYEMLGNIQKTFETTQNKIMENTVKSLDSQDSATSKSAKNQEKIMSEHQQKIAKDLEDENYNYQKALEKRDKSFADSLATTIFAHLDKVANLKKQISDETKDFESNMAERNKNFQESMAQMVKDHEAKDADIQKQIAKETKNEAEAEAEKMLDASDSIEAETKAYTKKADTIQVQIDKELAKGKNASATRVRLLRDDLEQETSDYEDKVASINEKVDREVAKSKEASLEKVTDLQSQLAQEDASYVEAKTKAQQDEIDQTAKLKTEHDTQVADYQASLTAEQTILTAHQDEVNKVKDQQRIDDIQRLINQHNDENAEALLQHQRKMADITASSGAEGDAAMTAYQGAIVAATPKITAAMSDLAKKAGDSMNTQTQVSAVDTGRNLVQKFFDSVKSKWNDKETWGNMFGIGTGPGLNILHLLGIPGFAKGVKDFAGGMAMVGENGPELVNLPAGSDVIPNSKAFGGGSPVVTNNNRAMQQTIQVHVGTMSNMADVKSVARELGFRASLQPSLGGV